VRARVDALINNKNALRSIFFYVCACQGEYRVLEVTLKRKGKVWIIGETTVTERTLPPAQKRLYLVNKSPYDNKEYSISKPMGFKILRSSLTPGAMLLVFRSLT
jgi:hypothetical protein